MKPVHQKHVNITMPRNTLRIYCPVEGSNERVVSDLFPVAAMEPNWPLLDDTTYGEIPYVTEHATSPWGAYKLRKIEPEGDLFCRLTFSRDIEAEQKSPFENPFKKWSEMKDKSWPPILNAIAFVKNNKFPQTTRLKDGTIVEGARLFKREDYTPGAREGTLFTYEHFVHSVEPKIPKYQCPQTSRVSFHYLGVQGEFPECLHDDLMFKSEPGAITLEVVGEQSVEGASMIPGQFFPATNFITWRPYVWTHEVVKRDVLFESVRLRLIPPNLPESSIGV